MREQTFNKKTVEKITTQEIKKILGDLSFILTSGSFVNMATCDLQGNPNVAPKLLAQIQDDQIYIIDYVRGKSYANLKANPKVSLSFAAPKTLTGYQLNGTVQILEGGEEFCRLAEEFQDIKTKFTVERILYGVRQGEKRTGQEFELPEQFALFKIKVLEVVEITSSGGLKSRVAENETEIA